MPERDKQVADTGGVGPQRVVAPGLGRFSVTEQIGGDNRVMLGQQSGDRVPLLRAADDAVNK
jgi:hypothetical protein